MAVESCSKCGTESGRYKDGKCISCARAASRARYHKDPEKHKAHAREWKQNNRERSRVSGRKGGRTNWLPGEHEKAEEALAKTTCCEICKSTDPRHKRGWNADHSHTTGKFRGIVCHPCNIALAHVEKFRLDRGPQIASYLELHK